MVLRAKKSRQGRPSCKKRRLATAGATMLSLFWLVGCSLPFGNDCNSVAGFGIAVTVVDSLTNASPTVVPTLRVSDGNFLEFIAAPNAGPTMPNGFLAAKERTGNYSVVVSATGYSDWSKANVSVVREGKCDVIRPVNLMARLSR
jgi:hypothetical protein